MSVARPGAADAADAADAGSGATVTAATSAITNAASSTHRERMGIFIAGMDDPPYLRH